MNFDAEQVITRAIGAVDQAIEEVNGAAILMTGADGPVITLVKDLQEALESVEYGELLRLKDALDEKIQA